MIKTLLKKSFHKKTKKGEVLTKLITCTSLRTLIPAYFTFTRPNLFQIPTVGKMNVFLVLVLLLLSVNLQAGEKAVTYSYTGSAVDWGGCPEFIPKGCEIGVLHGDSDKKNTDIFFKVPGDFEIPLHWHTSVERMVLLSGELTVSYDNQKSETMRPGTYGYGPAKLPHTAFCKAGDPCVLFIAFEEPLDAFELVQVEK
jgi:mannose-6-phosphate isomerase-like protein (cupin superfamily)